MSRRSSDGTILIRPPNIRIYVHSGEHGPVIRELRVHNLVPTCGLLHVRDLIGFDSEEIPRWGATPRCIAIGTDGTAPALSDESLGAEVLRRGILRRAPQELGLEWYIYVTTAEANGYALREVGLFTEAPAGTGTPWNRGIHPLINKTAAIAVSYRINWAFANGA